MKLFHIIILFIAITMFSCGKKVDSEKIKLLRAKSKGDTLVTIKDSIQPNKSIYNSDNNYSMNYYTTDGKSFKPLVVNIRISNDSIKFNSFSYFYKDGMLFTPINYTNPEVTSFPVHIDSTSNTIRVGNVYYTNTLSSKIVKRKNTILTKCNRICYTVKQGNTYYSIAKIIGVKSTDIQNKYPKLYPGLVIKF